MYAYNRIHLSEFGGLGLCASSSPSENFGQVQRSLLFACPRGFSSEMFWPSKFLMKHCMMTLPFIRERTKPIFLFYLVSTSAVNLSRNGSISSNVYIHVEELGFHFSSTFPCTSAVFVGTTVFLVNNGHITNASSMPQLSTLFIQVLSFPLEGHPTTDYSVVSEFIHPTRPAFQTYCEDQSQNYKRIPSINQET